MSDLLIRDLTADALHYESLYHTYRLLAAEGLHALRAAKLREESLLAQVTALRIELHAIRATCAELNSQRTATLATVNEGGNIAAQ